MTQTFGPVSLATTDGIGLIEIDNPPVNATSQRVRAGLLAAIEAADGDSRITAIVLAGKGRTFTAGGDISEFGKPPQLPHLPDVLNRIEACGKPVVAAWHGTALGGGCEMGLAAHARVIAAGASLGLPEVKLGLCPGAGGTQRLPRLAGLAAALDITCSGRMVPAREALALGIVDAVAEGDPRAAAIDLARRLIGKPLHRTGMRTVPAGTGTDIETALAKVRKEARGRLAPEIIAGLIAKAADLPLAEGMAIERQTFFDLMASDQSKALRHVFFAEREVAKVAGLDGIAPRRIEAVGVIGAGTMGAGIAVAFIDAGYAVTVIETTVDALDRGRERIAGLYDRMVKSGRISAETRAAKLAGITFATELSALAGADLVIEAVFEDMGVKQELLARLEGVTRTDAVLATNTSYLDIDVMVSGLKRPGNVVGLHFFSPAHVMKLLEIVRAAKTAPDVLASAVAVGKRLKKIAVVSGICDGFIGNRILARYRAQCEIMLEEGALPEDIDGALEAFGLPMGPFAVQDLSGLDIAWARRKRLAATRSPLERYVPIADRLCEAGRLGQKTGRGWYLYVDGKRQNDPEVRALVVARSAELGITRRPVAREDIQRRVLAAMVNEGAKIVGEGIAQRPLDVDIVMINGYGFPAWRGGPMHEADRLGLATILDAVRRMAAQDGLGFEPAPLLEQLVAEGRTFASLNGI